MLWSPLVSSLPWRRLRLIGRSHHLCPLCLCPFFVVGMDNKKCDNASCTTTCLSLLAKFSHENFSIMEGLMTNICAITATQKAMDGPSGQLCHDGCGATQNLIPAPIGTATAVGNIIQKLRSSLPHLLCLHPQYVGHGSNLPSRESSQKCPEEADIRGPPREHPGLH
uniref:Glyceraldehyde-3-phosphate dehydrogenase n=1 Tax=Sus scrofa TaxID=9823 RepID=A0A8D0WUX5_PIG